MYFIVDLFFRTRFGTLSAHFPRTLHQRADFNKIYTPHLQAQFLGSYCNLLWYLLFWTLTIQLPYSTALASSRYTTFLLPTHTYISQSAHHTWYFQLQFHSTLLFYYFSTRTWSLTLFPLLNLSLQDSCKELRSLPWILHFHLIWLQSTLSLFRVLLLLPYYTIEASDFCTFVLNFHLFQKFILKVHFSFSTFLFGLSFLFDV